MQLINSDDPSSINKNMWVVNINLWHLTKANTNLDLTKKESDILEKTSAVLKFNSINNRLKKKYLKMKFNQILRIHLKI